jgi:deoxycytidine triphosphate deaminase
MSILTNVEIRTLVNQSNLITGADEASFQPCSYDMRIGAIFRDGQVIDETHDRRNEQIRLDPGEVITMTTLEELNLPADIAGTAHAINAQSSEGLLVLNPGHIDPGYKGTLTVMAVNMRRVPYVISRKDKIFTVVLQRLPKAADPPYANKPGARADRERDLNKKVVEKAVNSLGDLIALNSPFTRPEDVDQRIKRHWSTIATMLMAGIAALTGMVAAVFAVASLFRGDYSGSSASGPPGATVPSAVAVQPGTSMPSPSASPPPTAQVPHRSTPDMKQTNTGTPTSPPKQTNSENRTDERAR